MSADVLMRLEDIHEQTENILSVVDGMTFEVFLSHVAWSAAVIRFFEVIGEAAKYIPEEVRLQYPDVAWKELAGFRDVLIHNYPKVNLRQVWNFAVEDVPPLKMRIEEIIAEMKNC
ncbi:MAG: DUF86 domain-containing protein [Methanocorpusculum sp.]|nr:DUF86 domain-containing protein [Methanocorpusculum sp.]